MGKVALAKKGIQAVRGLLDDGAEFIQEQTPMIEGLLSMPKKAIEYIYHGTSPEAYKSIQKNGFDLSKSADGSIWFTSNPNIGEVAASAKGAIIRKSIPENLKLGGWDETDKYSTDQLLSMGYDGLRLVDDGETIYQIFNPKKLLD